MTTDAEPLFTESYLAAISRLSLVLSPAPPRAQAGAHISPRAGASLQFRDFAPYSQGDDLRRIDWNIFARTRHLFVKRFDHPTAATISVVVDDSASMRLGYPGRFPTAARLALAVASAAVAGHDPVQIVITSNWRGEPIRATNRQGLARCASALTAAAKRSPAPIGLAAMLDTLLPRLAARSRGPLVVISDFFEDRGADALADALSRHPGSLLCMRLVEPSDLAPDLSPGDDVIDCETGQQLSLASGGTRDSYRTAYDTYFGTLDARITRRSGRQVICEVIDDPISLISKVFPGV